LTLTVEVKPTAHWQICGVCTNQMIKGELRVHKSEYNPFGWRHHIYYHIECYYQMCLENYYHPDEFIKALSYHNISIDKVKSMVIAKIL